jgi:hypothetical protein
MKPIMNAIGKGSEWKQLVEDIRQRHRNRPKLLEILDRLDDRPIVASRRKRG